MSKNLLTKSGPHGIDLTAPGGVAALIEHHRAMFGDARMELPTGDESGGESGGDDDGEGESPKPADEQQDPPGAENLGDAGKKALDAMKAQRNEAKAEAARLRDQLADLQAKVEGKEAERQKQIEDQRVRDEALAKANERILKAEVRAAAAGKLNDPADALEFIDLSKFEVGEDGDVDGKAIADAISDLINKKPYLAVQDGARFTGSGDGGARKETPKRAGSLEEAVEKRISKSK